MSHIRETENKTIFWDFDSPPMGSGVWPVMMGHLTSYGNFHHIIPLPDYFCPHIIIKGKGVVRCNGQEHVLVRGDMFSIWPNRSIEYFDHPDYPDQPLEYLWIHLGGEGTASYLNGCGFRENRLMFKPNDPAGVIRIFRQIRELYASKEVQAIPLILSRFYELITMCSSINDGDYDNLVQRNITEQAILHIETMLGTSLDINHIAKSLGVCRTTLYRAFLRDKGITPMEFLAERRIDRAKELLKTTNLNLSQISRLIGFSDQRYFIRCFRKRLGVTPIVFRDQG